MNESLLRRLRRRVLAPILLRAAGRLDGRALALREDLGALVAAGDRYLRTGDGNAYEWALDEARASIRQYDASRANPRARRRVSA